MFNKRIGRDMTLKDLSSQHDAVLVGIGAHGERELGIPGENLAGVHRGYEWLEAFASGKTGKPGRRTLVIGGGNVAIDVARTLYRLDSEVTVAYRRSARICRRTVSNSREPNRKVSVLNTCCPRRKFSATRDVSGPYGSGL